LKSRISVSDNRSLSPRSFRPATEWIAALQEGGPSLSNLLRQTYGHDASLIEERRKAILRLSKLAAKTLGPNRPFVICRSPGRVNLMGRHVDHRGGYANVMAIGKETLIAAAPRADDKVNLVNADNAAFPRRDFTITEPLGSNLEDNWVDFVDSPGVTGTLQSAPGDWSHYARAALLRLQHEQHDQHLNGMDCVVLGNVPMGAGLSSSSALLVAFAQAAVALNGLKIEVSDFVDLCGEAEWFVGSRGGSMDHAAITTSKAGYITRMGFFPFRVDGAVQLPDGTDVVVVDSGEKAVKSAGAPARDVFNQRVATYELAERLLRQTWRPAANVEHLRDLIPHRLGVSPSALYHAIASLPNRASRRRLRELLSSQDTIELDRLFSTHANLGDYDLRGVVLYGLGECSRSERFSGLLEKGDIAAVGRYMRVSHNGDRQWTHSSDGNQKRFTVRTDTASLNRLALAETDLIHVPGRYGCSTQAIDRIVDRASRAEGVIGAQITGAGLGGSAVVMVKSEFRDGLLHMLEREAGDGHTFVSRPVAGAGLLSLQGN
jgi:N-acetylgalactosamine kinase